MEQYPISQQKIQESERKKQLFLMQKSTLDTFLERGAITPAQYDFSYNGLVTKMNVSKEELCEWGVL
jgi:hypothetical protein